MCFLVSTGPYYKYVCNLAVNGVTGSGTLTSIHNTGASMWETSGTDAAGYDYCCNISPQSVTSGKVEYFGAAYADTMMLNYDNGTVYTLTSARMTARTTRP